MARSKGTDVIQFIMKSFQQAMNPAVRRNAVPLFVDAFPLNDPSSSAAETVSLSLLLSLLLLL